MRAILGMLAAVCAAALAASSAGAYSIVNVPTANQAALHEFNIAYYGLSVKKDLPPTHKDIFIAYSTVAPDLELEWIHVEINNGFGSQDLVNASYRVVREDRNMPDVVLGVKNLFEEENSPHPDERERSWYVATAKTLNPPQPGQPWSPVVRLHLNYGTKEHRGLFGGVQVAVTPQLGFVAMRFTNSGYTDTFFGNAYELAAVYSLGQNKPNLKVGTLGEHFWAGLDYSIFY